MPRRRKAVSSGICPRCLARVDDNREHECKIPQPTPFAAWLKEREETA